MPKVKFIFWERRGRLAAESRPHLDSAPATIQEVQDERGFLAALHPSTYPVVVLDRSAVGDRIADAIASATAKDAWIIVVGLGSADERRRDRDLGAHLLFHDVPHRRVWGATIRRLVAAIQRSTAPFRSA